MTISPTGYESLPPGSWITVSAEAPASANTGVTGWFYNSAVTGAATMMKEY